MVCVEMLHRPGQPESSWAFKTRFSLRQKRKDNLLRQKGVFRVSRWLEKMGNLRSGSKPETKRFETTSECLWLLELFMLASLLATWGNTSFLGLGWGGVGWAGDDNVHCLCTHA